MTILDAYAFVAYLRDEPAAEQVAALLSAQEANMTAVGLGEVFDHMVRVVGGDEEEVTLDLAELGMLEAIEVDAALGAAAGRLRARHYHRTRCPVSMADCVAGETARTHQRPVATSDPHLLCSATPSTSACSCCPRPMAPRGRHRPEPRPDPDVPQPVTPGRGGPGQLVRRCR